MQTELHHFYLDRKGVFLPLPHTNGYGGDLSGRMTRIWAACSLTWQAHFSIVRHHTLQNEALEAEQGSGLRETRQIA